MTERELSQSEVKEIYNRICSEKIPEFDVEYTSESTEFYYELDGKQYRLIYDRSADWFCDIIYEGEYK